MKPPLEAIDAAIWSLETDVKLHKTIAEQAAKDGEKEYSKRKLAQADDAIEAAEELKAYSEYLRGI